MSESTQATFVARESDLATLRTHFEGALTGTCTTVHLTSPVGGGKRALVGDFVSKLGDQSAEVLTWRSNLTDEEDGLRVILRLYASLYSALYRDPLLKSRVEMVLNAQVPQQTPRVQAWYKTFVDALRQPAPKSGDETFKVMLPRDNPALGLVEILAGISRKMPVIVDIQNLHFSHSLSTFALLEAILLREAVTPLAAGAIVVSSIGVLTLSAGKDRLTFGNLFRGLGQKSTLIGLASGFFLGASSVLFRGAALSLHHDSLLTSAAFTLVLATLLQTVLVTIWLMIFEKGQISSVAANWRVAATVGFAGWIASICWFTAFTLTNAAYVRALGQVELVFTFLVSVLFFREKVTRAEIGGAVLLASGIVILIIERVT